MPWTSTTTLLYMHVYWKGSTTSTYGVEGGCLFKEFVMKKITLFLFPLLISCNSASPLQVKDEPKMIEYPDSFIAWGGLFDKTEESYFVYIFAYDCYYCNELKSKVVDFYNKSQVHVYFCEYSKSIPIDHNIEATIGLSNIDNMFIKGTPTLILIKNKSVTFNVAGKADVSGMIDLHLKNE